MTREWEVAHLWILPTILLPFWPHFLGAFCLISTAHSFRNCISVQSCYCYIMANLCLPFRAVVGESLSYCKSWQGRKQWHNRLDHITVQRCKGLPGLTTTSLPRTWVVPCHSLECSSSSRDTCGWHWDHICETKSGFNCDFEDLHSMWGSQILRGCCSWEWVQSSPCVPAQWANPGNWVSVFPLPWPALPFKSQGLQARESHRPSLRTTPLEFSLACSHTNYIVSLCQT